MFEGDDPDDIKLYELGAANKAFNRSADAFDNYNNNNNNISIVKIITNLSDNHRRDSLKDYELVHRKNSFVAL